MSWYFGKSKKILMTKGFSLLELMVVITIFLIITATVIVDIPNFRNKSALDLTASEVATYIRGAQVYGISRKAGVSNYVIHLAIGPNTADNFYLFEESSTDHQEDYRLEGYYIDSIKGDSSGNINFLDISYLSQTYETSFATNLSPTFKQNGSPLPDDYYFQIEIRSIRSSSEPGKCVFVYKNGQITIGSCT